MSAPVLDEVPRGVAAMVRVATVLALATAVAGTVTKGQVSSVFGGVAVGLIIAAPLLRVAILGARWTHLHDRRFAVAAFVLLAVTGAGAVLALL